MDSSLPIVISVRVKNRRSDSGVTSDSCVARQLNHICTPAQYLQKDDSEGAVHAHSHPNTHTHTHARVCLTILVRTFH